MGNAVIFNAESYYKYYDQEPDYHLHLITQTGGYREILADPEKYGKKSAVGLETYIEKNRLDWLYYKASYSLFDVKRLYDNGKWYDDDYNFHNVLKLTAGSNFNKCHRLSGRLDLTEGAPYTPFDAALSNAAFQSLYDLSNGWNSKRRNTYVNLSIRYDYTAYFRKTTLKAYFEIENLLNEQTLLQESYDPGVKFPEGKEAQYLSGGIMPIGGMTVTF